MHLLIEEGLGDRYVMYVDHGNILLGGELTLCVLALSAILPHISRSFLTVIIRSVFKASQRSQRSFGLSPVNAQGTEGGKP